MNLVKILSAWQKMEKLPCGKFLFSKIIGKMITYSGSIGAVVQEFKKGYAVLKLADQKKNRNHLRCVHAIALANLGELTGGFAFLSMVPAHYNAIVVGFSVEYLKKARGTLVCTATFANGISDAIDTYDVVSEIKNSDGVCVAKTKAVWKVRKGGQK